MQCIPRIRHLTLQCRLVHAVHPTHQALDTPVQAGGEIPCIIYVQVEHRMHHIRASRAPHIPHVKLAHLMLHTRATIWHLMLHTRAERVPHVTWYYTFILGVAAHCSGVLVQLFRHFSVELLQVNLSWSLFMKYVCVKLFFHSSIMSKKCKQSFNNFILIFLLSSQFETQRLVLKINLKNISAIIMLDVY